MTQKPQLGPITMKRVLSGGLFARPEPPVLQATFVADNNIPDGHPFPAGVEFVKSWRLLNDGPVPWPVDTRLVFVAGHRMASHTQAPNHYDVGAVSVEQAVDVWAGDMKAPETPGHWTGYWRLSDGQGVQFGDRVWCDIVVMETEFSESTDHSLSSSSIIMPSSALAHAPTPELLEQAVASPTFSLAIRSSSTPSIDTQSVGTGSLLDEESDSDSEIWEETRRQAAPRATAAEQDGGFIVLYDSSSAEDA